MSRRLLLVDDEASIRRVLGITLEDKGYAVLTAEDGEEALQLFRDYSPDIVLADIKMPGMDGVQLLERIKEERPHSEVIMITGHGDMDLAIQSLKHEACDFVTKPINDDILDIALSRAEEKLSLRESLQRYTEDLEAMVREQSAKLVEAERAAAASQVLDRLTSAMTHIADNLDDEEQLYFNEVPCLVSLHNANLEVIQSNQHFRDRFGEQSEIRSWDIYGKKGSGDRDCPVKRCFDSGQPGKSKEFLLEGQGHALPVLVHTVPIPGPENRIDLVLELCVDLSRIEHLQEELFTTQKRYQELFDAVPCYITVQDRDLHIVASNAKFKADFGDVPEAFCYQVYKHRSEPCPDCPVLKAFADGRGHQSESVVTSRQGEQYNVLIEASPLRNAAGEVTQVMEVSTNITEIRRLQDHLTSLGLLLSSVSHSIKNLFTALDGGMYRVTSGLEKGDQDQIERGWHRVAHLIERIKKMVVDILNYAKQPELKFREIDVGVLCREVMQTVAPQSRGYEIELDFIPDRELREIEGDPQQLASAMENILENAVEACLADPKRTEKEHRISFKTARENGQAVFEIADNGAGMDRETKEKLFTLFFSSKGNRGTGLGLFVANQIVQRHQGRIEVQASPGEGSSFRIVLPLTQPGSEGAGQQ